VVDVWDCDAVCRDAGHAWASACGPDEAGLATCFCEDEVVGCYDYEESCGDGTCLDTAYVCDGIVDCATGTDELGCATCSYSGGYCNGPDHVDTCERGVETTWSCAAICAQSGFDFSDGCAYDAGSGTDSCFCGDAIEPECYPGDAWCTGDFTIEVCDDVGLWVDWDCDDVCQASGYDWAQGCAFDAVSGVDACFCDLAY